MTTFFTLSTFPRYFALAVLLLSLTSLLIYAQGYTREVEAVMAEGRATPATERGPEVRADFALLLSGAENSPTGRISFRGMTLNATHPTTGEFEIINQRGARLFVGRWIAMSFHNGETSISLEGTGQGTYAESRLKLKLKAKVETKADAPAQLIGQGSGEIK